MILRLKQKLLYEAFGLVLSSDIYFPELVMISEKIESIDVEIKIQDISCLDFELPQGSIKFVVKKNLVMFHIPDIATFSVQDGKVITVSLMKGADENQIRLLILGTCMGAILMQRRLLPLHGSAVVIDGQAYAFIGDSGAGKSTLALAFLSKGYKLITDDVIAISFSKDAQIPYVIPSYPQQKLWEESLNQLGMEARQYQSIFGRETKYCVPISSKYVSSPYPLAGIIELVKTENTEIEMRPIQKLEQFHTLFCHTYRNFLIADLELMDWHFNTSASILKKVDFYQLHRPTTHFTAHELTDIILDTIKKEENVHVKN